MSTRRSELTSLWAEVRNHFGDQFFDSNGVAFELAPKGPPAVHVAGLMFFRENGKVIAARVEGDGVQYWALADLDVIPSDQVSTMR